MGTQKQKQKQISVWWLAVLPVIAMVIALCIGRYEITLADILHSVSAKITGGEGLARSSEIILWNTRLPRVLLALLVGAGLSAAGSAYQSLFANPLATPDTLGVASGASFGAAVAMLFGMNLVGIQLVSVGCGLLAVALTVLAGSGKRKRNLSGIVLSGIMIGSLFNALISLVKYTADTENQLPVITYFLMGTLNGAGYENLALGAGPILVGVIILVLIRWRLNVLPLSTEEAKTIGVNIRALRIVTVCCSTVITASCVSMCGQVGWVGLLIPHLCRMIYGTDQKKLMPASVFIGATFMILADTVARSATASEIPISILTAIIGAPVFILLLRRTEGWQI